MAKSAPRPPKTDDDVDFAVPLQDALDPLVLALDVGSTATRGSLHDATGTPVRGYRDKIPHQFTTAADGTSTIDPDQVVEELCRLIDQIIGSRQELIGRVGGVAIDTFASSLVGVDSRRRATTTPAVTVPRLTSDARWNGPKPAKNGVVEVSPNESTHSAMSDTA